MSNSLLMSTSPPRSDQDVEAAKPSHAPLAEQVEGEARIVTTHIGTKINAGLGTIKSPVDPKGFRSAFDEKAVSGRSVPPKNHPVALKLQQQREEYTNRVLEFVLDRINNMSGLQDAQALASEFMSDIENESKVLFDESGLTGGEGESEWDDEGSDFCSEIYDSMMWVQRARAQPRRSQH